MHYLFIACNKNSSLYREDPSFIYRCENLGLALKEQGSKVSFSHISEISYSVDVDVMIFHRPSYSLKLFLLITFAKIRGVLCLADYDDLVFNSSLANTSPAVINNILPLYKVKKMFAKNQKALELFNIATFSTEPLKKHSKNLLPKLNTIVIENCVHYSWLNKEFKKNTQQIKKITYFPGTKSHDKDLALVEYELLRFVEAHNDVELHITGKISQTPALKHKRIFFHSKVAFQEYYKCFEDVWLNLAPLEINEFTKSKSALKVIESAFFNIPTLCSSIEDAQRFVGRGAVIVDDSKQFNRTVEELYDNQEYYHDISDNLRNKVLEIANIQNMAVKFENFIKREKRLNINHLFSNNLYLDFLAKTNRKKGKYTLDTLLLYKKLYLKTKTIESYVDYCKFRRDLGYRLTNNKYEFIKKNYEHLNRSYKNRVNELINDFQYKGTINDRVRNFNDQNIKTELICIVGNGLIDRGDAGNWIDSHDFVVRFNNCFNDIDSNRGKKIDTWVCAPDYMRKWDKSPKFVIVSGADILYKNSIKKSFDNMDLDNLQGIPLNIWRELVWLCGAPPSAGILMTYYLFKLRSSWRKIDLIGFDLTSEPDQYHYANKEHSISSRHNWEKEKFLLRKWKEEGLNVT